eukprot:g66225.t1
MSSLRDAGRILSSFHQFYERHCVFLLIQSKEKIAILYHVATCMSEYLLGYCYKARAVTAYMGNSSPTWRSRWLRRSGGGEIAQDGDPGAEGISGQC